MPSVIKTDRQDSARTAGGAGAGVAGSKSENIPATPASAEFDAPIESTRTFHTRYGEQDENGTDLSLIRELLRLPPLERLRRGDAATTDALWIRANARRIDPNAA